MSDTTIQELLHLNQRLLDCIAAGDWATYQELSDPTLTAFEPEGKGQLVEGLAFHQFYFQLGGKGNPQQTTMCSPKVRLMGDAAIVSYVRLIQRLNSDGSPYTTAMNETRIWERQQGRWQQVHFHRSASHQTD
jgi:calcium/calmodulin-dependent protein kinase (CaM kinase) II